ncbi:MAG: helix-turn-helix domain-containing protein [Clostridiales Family XIII bacterium]|nr:helix-turn-helix domain-containing protein [Clostridiales Family XIII bacterium]
MRDQLDRPQFDFSAIGAALKKAREERGFSRDALAEICDISAGYIKAIENTGKNPGFQLFWRLVTMFNISVDEYFYPDREVETDSQRRYVIGLLREIDSEDVYVVKSTIDGLSQRRAAMNEK